MASFMSKVVSYYSLMIFRITHSNNAGEVGYNGKVARVEKQYEVSYNTKSKKHGLIYM